MLNVKEVLSTLHRNSLDDISKTGVYTITSKTTKNIYVGSATVTTAHSRNSIGFEVRWSYHVGKLLNLKHPNIHLQAHVNKYGIEDLSFEILDFCEPKFAVDLERFWINQLDSVRQGFNQCYPGVVLFGKNHPNFITLEEDNVVNLYLNTKLSVCHIAKEFNVSSYKIVRILKERNIPLTKFRLTDDLTKEIYIQYLSGKSIENTLSEKYGFSSCTILNAFHRNKLKLLREIKS